MTGEAQPPTHSSAWSAGQVMDGSVRSTTVTVAEQLLDTPDRTDELRATGVPVLVAYGEADDAWPPAEQAGMATRLGADGVAIAGAGHSPAAELPDETAALLDRWWRTHA